MSRSSQPHISCTIPSVHDDTTLDCRLYHPDSLSKVKARDSGTPEQWRKRGIVVAHPYAPLGGSYDDRVVGMVVEEFLALDYIVGTFNFRGAHGSRGRTSWSGKPERDDYISFAAFFMHYLAYLRPYPLSDATFSPEQSPIVSRISSKTDVSRLATESSVVILGGYSYGSIVLRNLPPIPSILQPFSTPPVGCAASEIVLRARKLADQSNLEWINLAHDHERRKRKGHENKLSVTVGGEETSPDARRSSREIRRSIDGGSRSLDLKTRMQSLSQRGRKDSAPETSINTSVNIDLAITMPDIRYLLISPLSSPLSVLLAPGLVQRLWGRSKDSQQEVIEKHTTLAVYGDNDAFTSAKRMRQWAETLCGRKGSRFTYVEVAGGDHFWLQRGVDEGLRTALREWVRSTGSHMITE